MAITRRKFVVEVALGVAALPLLGKSALAQAKGKVGYMKIVDTAPIYVAMEKGFFKQRGLDLELVPMAGGATILPGVASGDLQVGWSNVISLYQAHVGGFDFKIVCGGAINIKGSNDTHALQVLKDSPIRQARDLEGMTVAVNTLNNIVHLMALAWLDKSGATSSKVKFVEIPFPQMEAAVVNKQIDAFVAVEPFVTVPSKVSKKTRVLGYPLGEIAPRLLIASYFVSEAWLKNPENEKTARAFVEALGRGIDAHNANPEEAKAVIAKYTGLKPEFLKELALPAFERKLLESDLQPMMDVAFQYKLIERKFPPKEVIAPLAL